MPVYLYFLSFLLCLWVGFTNVLCLFVNSFFLFFCVCGSVLPTFYANLLVVFFSFSVPVALSVNFLCLFIYIFLFCVCVFVCQYSMPLYLYFFVSFVTVSWFCQCSLTH